MSKKVNGELVKLLLSDNMIQESSTYNSSSKRAADASTREDMVSQLDLSKINHFLQISSYFKIFKIDDKSIGFMIGLKAGKDYKSENYIWINKRFSSFIYVDRIIIGSNYRNEGLGFYFYNHLIEH